MNKKIKQKTATRKLFTKCKKGMFCGIKGVKTSWG